MNPTTYFDEENMQDVAFRSKKLFQSGYLCAESVLIEEVCEKVTPITLRRRFIRLRQNTLSR